MRKHLWPPMVKVAVVGLVAAGLLAVAPAPPVAADGIDAPGAPQAFRALTTGDAHTCALLQDGQVKCWGANNNGQLGLGDNVARGDGAAEMGEALRTVNLGSGRTATSISAGASHTCALLDNGTVKCWGANARGQLGLGNTAARGDSGGEMGDNLPAINLGTGRTAVAISAMLSKTCALLDNGTAKCWGSNVDGQLGLGDTADRGDNAGEMGDSLPAISLGTGRTVVSINAGGNGACAILDNGTLKCWGDNTGVLGQGDTVDRGDNPGEMGDNLPTVPLGTGRTVTAVSVGQTHACALLDNTSLKCWGGNSSGQLGLGNTAARGDNPGEMGDSLPAVVLGTGRTVVAVSAGDFSTCARLDNLTLKCWGTGSSGLLGLGDTNARGDGPNEMGDFLPVVPLGSGRTVAAVTAAAGHTCARLDNATVKCWGANSFGQLGQGDTANRGDNADEMGNNLPPIALLSRRAASVSAGGRFTCALLDNGTVKCVGEGDHGQLGQGSTNDLGDDHGETGDALPAINLGTGRTARSLSAGDRHVCAVLDNGTVKCWGLNADGQLGLGDVANRGDNGGEMGNSLAAVSLGTGRTAVAVAAGTDHTCALLDNGSVKCWGVNSVGQLGVGDTVTRGDNAGEMGDSLPAVNLGTGRTATAIAAGTGHTCARLDNGSVKCWGFNHVGQLGLGNTQSRGDGPGEMGDSLPAVSLGAGRTATALAAGWYHSCARLDNGTLKCWGYNPSGQLGQGDTNYRGDGPGEMGDSLPAISVGTARTVTGIDAEENTTCARLDNGIAKCWGENLHGELGQGDQNDRGDNAGEMGDALPPISLGGGRTAAAVATGSTHSCARLDNGGVKCWGANGQGQLGLGDDVNRGDGPGEMGDNLPAIPFGASSPSGLSGTISALGSGAPVAGVHVAVLRSSDFALAGGAVTDNAGFYSTEVPPGTYFLYLIDSTGTRVTGFGTPNPVRPVAPDSFTDADTSVASTRGAITGTVVEDGTGNPIPGAFVISLTAGGSPEVGTLTNGSGVFALQGLAAANHFVGYVDPTGQHVSEFFPNSPTVPGGSTVAVSAGGTAVANDSMAVQTPIPGGSTLSGTITEQGTGLPLANTFVAALRASDFKMARSTLTNASGQYSLNVQAGGYKLAFADATGRHFMEWHNNQPNTGLGTSTTVTAPAVTNAALDRNTGSVSGTVVDGTTAQLLPDSWVFAIGPTGIAGGTVVRANGTYSVTGLAPGTYRVTFVDPTGVRAQEYWNNALDFGSANTVNVTAGSNTGSINGSPG